MTVDASTTARTIIDAVNLYYGYIINDQQACNVRKAILHATAKEIVADYTKVLAYL